MAVRKAALGSQWASVTDVITKLDRARSNRQAQQRLLGSLEDRVAKRRADVERSLSDLPQMQRSDLVNRAISGFRNELKRESADNRLTYVREAGRHLAEIANIRTH